VHNLWLFNSLSNNILHEIKITKVIKYLKYMYTCINKVNKYLLVSVFDILILFVGHNSILNKFLTVEGYDHECIIILTWMD